MSSHILPICGCLQFSTEQLSEVADWSQKCFTPKSAFKCPRPLIFGLSASCSTISYSLTVGYVCQAINLETHKTTLTRTRHHRLSAQWLGEDIIMPLPDVNVSLFYLISLLIDLHSLWLYVCFVVSCTKEMDILPECTKALCCLKCNIKVVLRGHSFLAIYHSFQEMFLQ